jgi:hypothetical protein
VIRDGIPHHSGSELEDDRCDIVREILNLVIALDPSFDPQLAGQIEAEVRATYGGQRVRIPKRGKYLTAAERQEVLREALTDIPTEEILRKHKIGGTTLRRWLKQGGQ